MIGLMGLLSGAVVEIRRLKRRAPREAQAKELRKMLEVRDTSL